MTCLHGKTVGVRIIVAPTVDSGSKSQAGGLAESSDESSLTLETH